jgi:hypothetical protein
MPSMNSDTNTTDTLATNARATIDKLRADIAETERDIEFQQLRLNILQDTLALLSGEPLDVGRQRQPRKRRTLQPYEMQNVTERIPEAAA